MEKSIYQEFMLYLRAWADSLDSHLADREPDPINPSRSRRIGNGSLAPKGCAVSDTNIGAVWLALLVYADDPTQTPTQTKVSYERIARTACLSYRQVLAAVGTLTKLGFVQKLKRDQTTNVTRLFQKPHLPVEDWTQDLPPKEYVDVSAVLASAENLKETNKARRAEKKGKKPIPSGRRSTAKNRELDLKKMVDAVLQTFSEHWNFQSEEGQKWLRRFMTRCIDQVGGDSGLAFDVLAYVLLPNTVEGVDRLFELERSDHVGFSIQESFPSWVEEYKTSLEAGNQPPSATAETITFDDAEEAL